MRRMNIAVVGSGVTGLSAAWLLSSAHDVTLIERDGRLGGHANTVDVETPDGRVPIDTGFIVYNVASYPNLIALFEHLGVETAPTRMTFSASLDNGRYEYSGSGAAGLFGQPANLFRPRHWIMIRDILRFFREAGTLDADPELSLGAWLNRRGYSRAFVDGHILPMAAAIWSAPARELMAYPAAAFARFFANHGLLQVRDRPQWRTVVGGSWSYVQRVSAPLLDRAMVGNGVAGIRRSASGAEVTLVDGTVRRFDQVVLACHADEAAAMLTDADADERRLLGAFRYQSNTAVLHTDARQMPRRRHLWSSWNYMDVGGESLCVSYWMNALQPLATTTDYFVTLNPPRPIAPPHVVQAFSYAHPVFDARAMAAQRELWRIQGRRAVWFAGSYCGSGFHEDGLQAGLWVAERLGGVRRPWPVDNGRIVTGPEPGVFAEAAE